MQTIQITIQGGDSAHRLRMLKLSSNVWMFPDGIERIITMSGWHWTALDYFLNELRSIDLKEFAARIFRLAKQEIELGTDPTLSFEQWLHRMAKDLVRISWDEAKTQNASNNNGFLDYHKQTP